MTDQPGGGWANPAWGEPAGPPPPLASQSAGGSAYPPPGPAGYHAPPPHGGQPYWGQPYGGQPDPALKPGVVPLRPLGVGEVLDGAITTIRRHPRITIGLAALVVTVQQVISVAAQLGTGSVGGTFRPGASFGSAASSGLDPLGSVIGLALSGVNLVIGTVLGAILTGVLMVVVGESVLGRAVALRTVWQQVRPRFWALLGGSLLSGLLPWAGLLVGGLVGLALGFATNAVAGVVVGLVVGLGLLIPGAYLWGMLALTTPAITLERLGPLQGLRRSWQLVRSDFWRVWGIRALATVIGSIISSIIVVPFALVGAVVVVLGVGTSGGEPSGGRLLLLLVITSIGGILAGAIVQPFVAGVIGLLYVDRRMRGEGLDIALQEAARTARAPQPAAGGPIPGWS